MILFKDTKEGQSVYMFCRNNADYKVGTIINTPTMPHYTPNQPVLMVDLSIRVDDTEKTYSIPENLSVTYAGDWCIATEPQDLLREIESLDMKAEKGINDVPRLQDIREKCKKLKLELNPQLRAQQYTEQRFEKLENNLGELSNMFKEFIRNQKAGI